MPHEVRIKPAARGAYDNRAKLHGDVVRWDVENGKFYLVQPNDRNALFQHVAYSGTPIPFDDVEGVYLENPDRPGLYEETNLISAAKRHYAKYGTQFADPKQSDVLPR
jgi:hypothetical protein